MIRAGFIGTGGISGTHLKVLQARKDVKVVGLADIREEAAKKRQEQFGGDIFTDYEEMLDRTKPDAVWLCTPPVVRREPLLACADRRIPVFCEKPAELRAAIAVGTAAELRRRRAKVQIGYVFRSMPVVAKLREALADDKPHLLQSFYGCPMSLAMKSASWFYDQSKSGGALVDQATHNLDLLRYLFGEVTEIRGMAHNPVHRKAGNYTIDEVIGLVFKFASGLVASHVHTWVGDSWRNEISISGEKRIYRLLLNKGQLAVEQVQPAANDPLKGKAGRAKGQGPLQFEQGSGSIFEYENDRFVRQVKTGDWSTNPCDYADGVKSLQLTLACYRAVVRGSAKV
jgi:predicted dehydrogenase